ncbi:hypothetical protein Bca4012_078655 [Brassica carinata]
MPDWGPVFVAVALFVLLTPGVLIQIPGKNRVVEFGTFQTSGLSVIVHTLIYFTLREERRSSADGENEPRKPSEWSSKRLESRNLSGGSTKRRRIINRLQSILHLRLSCKTKQASLKVKVSVKIQKPKNDWEGESSELQKERR